MDRYLLISSDCHAGPPPEIARGYVDPKHRAAFDAWIAGVQGRGLNPGATKTDIAGASRRQAFNDHEAVASGGITGAWDAAVRTRELDREGVAAEVIFPDGPNNNYPPFGVGFQRPREELAPELQQAGAHAYNRWLADLCATDPHRHAGLALLTLHDVDAAVREVEWARKAGLTGGVMLPSMYIWTDEPEAFWHHPRYEPIWAVCEDLGMPVHTHTSGPHPRYGESPGTRWLTSMEAYWNAHRIFWFLIWSGALERHPKLMVVTTESGGGGVPYMLELCDNMAADRNPEAVRQNLSLKPSEYWRRQCYIGASPPSGRAEVEMRHQFGLDKLMWGSDYPHIEGTWPRSIERAQRMFDGVPEREVRMICGGNAAAVYGFDLQKLDPLAARIGPKVTDLGLAGGSPPRS